MYQPVPPSTDPVPTSTNQYRPIMTDPVPLSINHYRHILIQFHQVQTSIDPFWPSAIIYESVPLNTDPVPQSINQYRPILIQYHHVLTSTAFYWPSTTKYQPLPPSTDPVPSYINQYQLILLLPGDCRLLHSLLWVLFIVFFIFNLWLCLVVIWKQCHFSFLPATVRSCCLDCGTQYFSILRSFQLFLVSVSVLKDGFHFYRTRVPALSTLVSNWLTDSFHTV